MTRRAIAGIRGILTGASSGIGRALAEELVRQGGRIIVVARRLEKLQALAESLAGAPGRLEIVAGDITLPATRAAALQRATVALGGLDLLINNAGIGAQGRFADADPARMRKIMDVNFFAAADMIREALPSLKAGAKPMIVNVSSVIGHRALPHASEYCASKFALRGFSDSLRAELAPLGIDVLVVSPGRTETEFFDSAIEQGKYPWADMTGVSAEKVARATVAAIRRGKHEVIPSLGGRVMVFFNRLAPGILDRYLARFG